MRVFKQGKHSIFSILALACLTVSAACYGGIEDEVDESFTYEDLVRDRLGELGFDAETAVINEDTVMVEGDMIMSTESLLEEDFFRGRYIRKCQKGKGCGPNDTLKIFIEGSVPQQWRGAINAAAKQWKNAGAPVQVVTNKGASNAMIRFGAKHPHTQLKPTTLAAADFPQKNAFKSIHGGKKLIMVINSKYTGGGTRGFCDSKVAKKRTGLMLHEMGHWLGFTHHDSGDGFLIPGTQQNKPSVMKTFCEKASLTLQGDDKKAVKAVY